MSDVELGAGDIEIELDGKAQTLRPSLDACIAISRIGGGLQAATQRCLQLDMDTICTVIQAGLGLNPVQSKMVPEAVFRTGLIQLSGPCIDFISIVGNGGKPLADDDGGGGEDRELDPPRPAFP